MKNVSAQGCGWRKPLHSPTGGEERIVRALGFVKTKQEKKKPTLLENMEVRVTIAERGQGGRANKDMCSNWEIHLGPIQLFRTSPCFTSAMVIENSMLTAEGSPRAVCETGDPVSVPLLWREPTRTESALWLVLASKAPR